MPDLPNKVYLRRGVVRDWLGVSDRDFTDLVEAGVLTPLYLRGLKPQARRPKGDGTRIRKPRTGVRAYYARDEVMQALRDAKICRPTNTKN